MFDRLLHPARPPVSTMARLTLGLVVAAALTVGPAPARAQIDCLDFTGAVVAGVETVSDSTISLSVESDYELTGCPFDEAGFVIRWPLLSDSLSISNVEKGADWPSEFSWVVSTETDSGFKYAWILGGPGGTPVVDFGSGTLEMVKLGYNRSGSALIELVPDSTAEEVFDDEDIRWKFEYTFDQAGGFFNMDTKLPVELAAFRARAADRAVRLSWRTASETRNSGFVIERKHGEVAKWVQLGFVEGTGTTAEPQTYRFEDTNVPYDAETVRYRLKQVDTNGQFTYSKEVEVEIADPERLTLHGNAPNPFAEQTTIRYEVPLSGRAELAVYDVLGQCVATLAEGRHDAGRHEITWAPRDLPSGVYFLRLTAEGASRTQKLTVVR